MGEVHPGEGSGEGAPAGEAEVFMPLVHRVGEGQVHFGYALAKVSGVFANQFFLSELRLNFRERYVGIYWDFKGRKRIPPI